MAAKPEALKVFVRIRPTPHCDETEGSDDIIAPTFEYNAEENQFILKDRMYEIDGILPPPTKQNDVYHRVATNPIDAFLEGYNSTIFAYGQTGSGKTHTIFGPEVPSKSLLSTPTKSNYHSTTASYSEIQSQFGLVPRCFITVFERLSEAKHIKKYQITLSCVEVYNTTLRDIFKPSNSSNLKIREDFKTKHFFVEHLTEESVQSVVELLVFIRRIQLNRSVSSTKMNEASSRSHVLLQLRVIQQLLSGETKESLLTFCDLAGSEMVRKTGTKGAQLKEAGYINSSLSTLSRVIEGLGLQHSDKSKKAVLRHIPFRDSSLTKLLKTALGGNCKTTLIVCVSASTAHREETNSSLQFATRAACIKNAPIINKALDAKALYEENLRLKAEVARLTAMMDGGDRGEEIRRKLEAAEAKESEVAELKRMNEELTLKMERIDNMERLEAMQEEKERLRQNMNELEIELMRERHAKETLLDKVADLQVMHSDVASQGLLDDAADAEPHNSLQNEEIVDLMLRFLPDDIKQDLKIKGALHDMMGHDDCGERGRGDDGHFLRNLSPVHFVRISKALDQRLKSLKCLAEAAPETPCLEMSLCADIAFIDDVKAPGTSTFDMKTTESVVTEYNPESRDMLSSEMKQFTFHSAASFARIYRNDSGTEISFDPISCRRDDRNEELVTDRDVRVELEQESQKSLPTVVSVGNCNVDRANQTIDFEDLEQSPVVDVETGCSFSDFFCHILTNRRRSKYDD